VEVVSREGTRTWLRLAKGADDQRVLHAALATGPVSAFVSEQPPLTELYRDLVTRTGAPGEDAAGMADTGATAGAGKTAGNRTEGGER
jgi:ABC-2 type transport system ATP-binding protein